MANIINTIEEPIALMYISEAVSPINNNVVKNMSTNKSADLFYVTFETNLQDFDVKNRNQRYYDGDNVMSCIENDPKIQSLLASNGWFGEFEHPELEFEDQKFTPKRLQSVPPQYRAFKILNPRRVGNVLTATIQSAQGTVGEGFGKEVIAGWIPQFSARAVATMTNRNGKPYVMMKKLITYDAPWYPSHAIAHATSKPVVHTKSFTESVKDGINKVKDKINGVMIPLKEILEEVGNKDVTTGMILESFDLTNDNLVGFNNSKTKVIIKDEGNIIYANINPETVKKVKDFYSSF